MAGRYLQTYFTPQVLAMQKDPQYITPRFSAAEVGKAMAPLQARIAELEALLDARR